MIDIESVRISKTTESPYSVLPGIELASAEKVSDKAIIKRRYSDVAKLIPFAFMHLACLAVVFVGISLPEVLLCLGLYAVRMFALTAGYHWYSALRSFKTSRVFQFVLALSATMAVRKGPRWWQCHPRP